MSITFQGRGRGGQMHIMETITSAVLIFVALLTISSIYTSPDNAAGTEGSTVDSYVKDILSIMASGESASGRNAINYYISNGNISGLVTDLDGRLPDSICFNIYLLDGNSVYLIYYFHEPAEVSDTESVLVSLDRCTVTDLLSGNEVDLDGGTYRLVLVTWREPRDLNEMLDRVGFPPENTGSAEVSTPDLAPDMELDNTTDESNSEPLPLPPPGFVLGSAAAAILGGLAVGFAVSDAGRYRMAMLLSPLAYTRLKEEELLNNATRNEIFRIIEENPGITYSDLLGEIGIGRGTLLYHLERLEKEEYIRSWRDGLYRRFTAYGQKRPGPILNETQKMILRIVAENPGISKTEIARLVGTSRQNIQHHISRLQDMGAIRIEKEGRRTRIYLGET